MPVYEVECTNTVLSGENRTYLVDARDCGGAEKKAIEQMNADLDGERGKNYATSVLLVGTLVR
jgi:hypothetical protein